MRWTDVGMKGRKRRREALALQDRAQRRARGPGRPPKAVNAGVHINIGTVNVSGGAFIATTTTVVNEPACAEDQLETTTSSSSSAPYARVS